MKDATKRLGLVVAVLGLMAGIARQAEAGLAFTISGANAGSNGSWAFGEIFTVGSNNITVTALGAYDAFGDGFVTPGGIDVGLYDESTDSLLASTKVQSSNPLVDGFRFSTISPLLLLAGHQYNVVAVSSDDLYNFAQSSVVVNLSITLDGFRYSSSSILTNTPVGGSIGLENRVWMSNFQISPVSAVPEPSSIALVCTALPMGLGIAWNRRRKAAAA